MQHVSSTILALFKSSQELTKKKINPSIRYFIVGLLNISIANTNASVLLSNRFLLIRFFFNSQIAPNLYIF